MTGRLVWSSSSGRPSAQAGDRVRLISTDDEWTDLVPGDEGTVVRVDSLGSVDVRWDRGSRLSLIPEHDRWERISANPVDNEC